MRKKRKEEFRENKGNILCKWNLHFASKALEPLLKKMVYGILSISMICNNSNKEIETWIGDFAVESQAMKIRKSRKREGRKNGKTKSEKARAIEIEQKYKICNLCNAKLLLNWKLTPFFVQSTWRFDSANWRQNFMTCYIRKKQQSKKNKSTGVPFQKAYSVCSHGNNYCII